jgi:hypothetical protein
MLRMTQSSVKVSKFTVKIIFRVTGRYLVLLLTLVCSTNSNIFLAFFISCMVLSTSQCDAGNEVEGKIIYFLSILFRDGFLKENRS